MPDARRTTRLRVMFWVGWLASSASYGLFQDLMGKTRYLRWADQNWVSGWYTIPVELVLVLFCFGRYYDSGGESDTSRGEGR